MFFAVDTAGNSEGVKTEIYSIVDTMAPQTSATPVGGTYYSQVDVTLAANEPAVIYYTTDGSTPTTASAVYSGPISIQATTTLMFFAVDTAGNSEGVKTEIYSIVDTMAPQTSATPVGGTYYSQVDVTLAANEPAVIYYTTDGSTPTTASAVYSGPISIQATTTLMFFAVDTAGNSEGVKTEIYSIVDTMAPQTSATPVGGTYYSQVDVTLAANEPAVIYYTTDGSMPTTASAVYSGPISIQATTTLMFFAVDTAGNSEGVNSVVYTIQAAPTGSPIVHQASSGHHQDYGIGYGSISWSHTVSDGPDRILIVTTAINSNSGGVVSAVTFGGSLLTRKAVRNTSWAEEVQLWYMLSPPVGTYQVAVDYTHTNYGIEARASTYTGVSQNKPFSDVATAGGSNAGPARSRLSSAAGELVIDALAYRSGAMMTADATQTERYNQSGTWNGAGASEKSGAASVTMSWALQNSGTWSMVAASLRPAQNPAVRTVTVRPSGGDYTSLNAALAGEAADLVALNRQLNIELYAMTDTEAVDLITPAYVTDPDRYIKVYTPAAERHAGVWDAGKYHLDAVAQIVPGGAGYPACFTFGEVDLWLDGVQAVCSYAGTDYPSMISADPGPGGVGDAAGVQLDLQGELVRIERRHQRQFHGYLWTGRPRRRCGYGTPLLRISGGVITAAAGGCTPLDPGRRDMVVERDVGQSGQCHLAGFGHAVACEKQPGAAYCRGIFLADQRYVIQPDSDYNASNLNETLVGSHSLANQTFIFQGTDDWRLSAFDAGAMENGVNSYNSYNVNDGKDIAGNSRDAFWDIGANEYMPGN